MATIDIVTVQPSGGDYTSLFSCEASEAGDFVTDDIIKKAELRGDWTSGADTSRVQFNSSTTDSTRYWWLIGMADSEFVGVYDTSKYRLDPTTIADQDAIEFNDNDGVLEHFQIDVTKSFASYAQPIAFNGTGTLRVDSCWIGGDDTGSGTYHHTSSTLLWLNNICVDQAYAIYSNGNVTRAHNNTVVSCPNGFRCNTASNFYSKNNGFSSVTTQYPNGTPTGADTTNSTSTPTFEDAGSNDYRLASSDTTWAGNGTDLSSDSDLAVTTDVANVTRPGSPAIGASEPVSTAGASGVAIFSRNRRFYHSANVRR